MDESKTWKGRRQNEELRRSGQAAGEFFILPSSFWIGWVWYEFSCKIAGCYGTIRKFQKAAKMDYINLELFEVTL